MAIRVSKICEVTKNGYDYNRQGKTCKINNDFCVKYEGRYVNGVFT